jgi:hypothetical protein
VEAEVEVDAHWNRYYGVVHSRSETQQNVKYTEKDARKTMNKSNPLKYVTDHVYILDFTFLVVTVAAVATVLKCGSPSKVVCDTAS